MSSGKFHDRISIFCTIPFAIALFHFTPETAALATIGYTAGWLILSPDIDLPQSRPSQRWLILSPLWWPYQKTHRHRGLSHWPLIGSAERLLYLFSIACVPVWAIALHFGFISGTVRLDLQSWQALFALYVGVESACLLHLFCDYCPGVRRL